jgi:hypothetical protein
MMKMITRYRQTGLFLRNTTPCGTTLKNIRTAIVSAVIVTVLSVPAAWGETDFLPSPFPLCPMDGDTSRMTVKIDALYSNVKADVSHFDSTGISAICVKENPDVGKPSYHMGLFGEIVNGELTDEAYRKDVKGYAFGASLTPSFLLTDRFQGFRPSVFIGSNIVYQSLDVDESNYTDDYIQLMRLAHMLGYIYDSIPVSREKEVYQVGFYTGLYLKFTLGPASISPFIMTQMVRGRAEWKYTGGDDTYPTSLAVHTAGLEFHLDHPGITVVTMARIVREKSEEDAKAYSVTAGVTF